MNGAKVSIAKNRIVTVAYIMSDGAGRVINSSEQDGLMRFMFGVGECLFPRLEEALEGKRPGDHVEITLDPIDAYGERNYDLIEEIPRSQFDNPDLSIGMQFQTPGRDGIMQVVTVAAFDGDNVIIDGNPPLAGVSLYVVIDIIDVRDPTPEEIKNKRARDDGRRY